MSGCPRSTVQYIALDLAGDSGGWFSDDQTSGAVVYRGLGLRYEQAVVPSGQYRIIDESLAVGRAYLNGAVGADFGGAALNVRSPFVKRATRPRPEVFESARRRSGRTGRAPQPWPPPSTNSSCRDQPPRA